MYNQKLHSQIEFTLGMNYQNRLGKFGMQSSYYLHTYKYIILYLHIAYHHQCQK